MKHKSNTAFYCLCIVAVGLIIGGFICPPTGVIDGSVLTAVGELLLFAVIARLPRLLEGHRDVTITHGQSSISVHNSDTDNE